MFALHCIGPTIKELARPVSREPLPYRIGSLGALLDARRNVACEAHSALRSHLLVELNNMLENLDHYDFIERDGELFIIAEADCAHAGDPTHPSTASHTR